MTVINTCIHCVMQKKIRYNIYIAIFLFNHMKFLIFILLLLLFNLNLVRIIDIDKKNSKNTFSQTESLFSTSVRICGAKLQKCVTTVTTRMLPSVFAQIKIQFRTFLKT